MNSLLSIIDLKETTVIAVLFMIIGGLGIFLYGLTLMSSSLKSLAGSKLKTIIGKATDHPLKGLLVGILVTIAIQSSSATTVIVVGLITAGLIDLKKALPIMIGAHIGTTVLAFIISIGVEDIAFPLIFLGAIIVLMVERRKWNLTGRILLGFGFIFLGMMLMSVSFSSFSETTWFSNIMDVFSKNWILGYFSGMFLTALIQSSGAFIGIVQGLYVTEATMSTIVALTLVIGSNVGTSITAVLASLGGNRSAKQAAIANSFIAFTGSLFFLALIYPVNLLFNWFQNVAFSGERSMLIIALFHLFYNIVIAAIMLPLSQLIAKLIEKIIPNKGETYEVSAERLNNELLDTPSLAIESARSSMLDMNNLVLEMYRKAEQYFNVNDESLFKEVNEIEEKVDLYEHLIHDYLMKLNEKHLSKKDAQIQTEYLDVIRDFERIGDHATNFVEFTKRYYESGVLFPQAMKQDLNFFFGIVDNQISDTVKAFENQDTILADNIKEREQKINEMEKDYRLNVHSYFVAGEVTDLDILFVDIISNLERVSDHTTNIAEMILNPHMMSTMITGVKDGDVVDIKHE